MIRIYELWTGRGWVSVRPEDIPKGVNYVRIRETERESNVLQITGGNGGDSRQKES